MAADLLAHEARQRRIGSAVLGLCLGAFAFFGIGITGTFSEMLDTITRDMPDVLRVFVGADVPGGYVVGEIFTLITPIAMVAYAVVAGSGALAGEERDGTMAILSAQPVTRTRVLRAKAGGLALALLGIGALFWSLMALAGWLFGSDLTPGRMAAGTVHLVFLAAAFAAIALAVGAATGRPEAAASVTGGLAVAAYLASTMLPLAGLDQWARLSPWYYALGSDPLRGGVDPAHLGVLAAIVAVAMGFAVTTFDRRDLRG